MPGPRIAIYGRHSTSLQNPTSSADQAAACRRIVDYLGGEIVEVYLDPELSGYRRDRPAFQRMLADARAGRIDVVVSEALDRLARDAEDVAWLGKKLKFDRVRIFTVSEGEIDDVKLAVASLLGSLFLSQLRQKTFRGMEAAVLAGRCAGGRSYGYSKIIELGSNGELKRGLIEIDDVAAEVVRRIFTEFADGMSAIQIATRLNHDGVPGPRGGQWNASTIRGNPKTSVGILNNELYVGVMLWGRREWRKDPNSEGRERRYRIRPEDEWIRVSVPDLRIVDDGLWDRVRKQLAGRSRPNPTTPPVLRRRRQHLLSGTIRCASCGSNYVISGKDYYRCAGRKERGTCDNAVSLRQQPLEDAVLSVLQSGLLTNDHAEVFKEEFAREVRRLDREQRQGNDRNQARLAEIDREIANLTANMLAGVIGPTLQKALADREHERDAILARCETSSRSAAKIAMPSASEIVGMFENRIANLRGALGAKATRPAAAEAITTLIEAVLVHPDRPDVDPEGEIVASSASLIAFAMNAKSPPRGGGLSRMGCSIKVVAGTGFEPVTFRL